jgi:hypothetical protein
MTKQVERDSYRVREAVGVFADSESLEAAVNELDSAGFSRASISVLGSADEVRNRVGHLYRTAAEMEDDIRAPRSQFISTSTQLEDETAAIIFPLYIGGLAGVAAVAASGGALALAIAAAIIGAATGAGAGGLLAGAIAEHHARRIAEKVAQGGLVLWVKVADDDTKRRAVAILTRAGAQHVHVHELQRKRDTMRPSDADRPRVLDG